MLAARRILKDQPDTYIQVLADLITMAGQSNNYEELRNEGISLFRAGQFYTGNLPFKLRDEQQAADIYAYSKHRELSIKQALRTFAAEVGIKL